MQQNNVGDEPDMEQMQNSNMGYMEQVRNNTQQHECLRDKQRVYEQLLFKHCWWKFLSNPRYATKRNVSNYIN